MTDSEQEPVSGEVLDRLAEPASAEAEMLRGEKDEDFIQSNAEAQGEKIETMEVKEKQDGEGEGEAEKKLPELSAAEFRAYNSMAEHMEYFVRRPNYPHLEPVSSHSYEGETEREIEGEEEEGRG